MDGEVRRMNIERIKRKLGVKKAKGRLDRAECKTRECLPEQYN